MFQVGLRVIPKYLQGCFKGASRVSKRSSKGVPRKFQIKVSMVFQECVHEVLFCDFVAFISLQLPEQKEGLFRNNLGLSAYFLKLIFALKP